MGVNLSLFTATPCNFLYNPFFFFKIFNELQSNILGKKRKEIKDEIRQKEVIVRNRNLIVLPHICIYGFKNYDRFKLSMCAFSKSSCICGLPKAIL